MKRRNSQKYAMAPRREQVRNELREKMSSKSPITSKRTDQSSQGDLRVLGEYSDLTFVNHDHFNVLTAATDSIDY